MSVFNLQKFIKEAFAKPVALRKKYDWFTYEDIESGNIKRWNDMFGSIPSCETTFNSIRKDRNDRLQRVMDRFKVGPEIANQILKVYIGISIENQGLYGLTIGPYMACVDDWQAFLSDCVKKGYSNINDAIKVAMDNETQLKQQEKEQGLKIGKLPREILRSKGKKGNKLERVADSIRKDLLNNFAIFNQAYKFVNVKEVLSAAKIYLVNNFAAYLGIIDETDLQFHLKGFVGKGNVPPSGKKKRGRPSSTKTIRIYENLTENSPDMGTLTVDNPFNGEGTQIEIGRKGIYKILEAAKNNSQSPFKLEILNLIIQKNLNSAKEIIDFIRNNDNLPPTMLDLKSKGLIDNGINSLVKTLLDENSQNSENTLQNIAQKEINKNNSPDAISLINEMFSYAIETIAKKNSMSANTVEERIKKDRELLEEFYVIIKNKQRELIASNDERAAFLVDIPVLSEMKQMRGNVGALWPESLRARPSQVAAAKVKKDIMTFISGTVKDPDLIAKLINKSLEKTFKNNTGLNPNAIGQGLFSSDDIKWWISTIEKEREGRSDEQLLSSYTEEHKTLLVSLSSGRFEGLKNSKSAYELASQYFAGMPEEEFVVSLWEGRVRKTFEDVGNFPQAPLENYSSTFLQQKRQHSGSLVENSTSDGIKLSESENASNLLSDLLSVKEMDETVKEMETLDEVETNKALEENEEDIPITEVQSETENFPITDITGREEEEAPKVPKTPETAIVSTPPPKLTTPDNDEDDEEDDSGGGFVGFDPKKVNKINYILNNLIKIATELNKEGKHIESQEILKIVKKYS